MKHGDFGNLAENYSKNRPDYSAEVLDQLINLINIPITNVDFVDIGAGTGIWTRMVMSRGVRSAVALEPNEDMRKRGISDSSGANIKWVAGSAEISGLNGASFDWLTMASAFHWVDFQTAIKEFHRLLRKGGCFTAIWNPRLIEGNSLLEEIDAHLGSLQPSIKRISSGRSTNTEELMKKLNSTPYFHNVNYLEGQHVIRMSRERYLGIWHSVNDLPVQLGTKKFQQFLDFVNDITAGVDTIEAAYLTRAWSVFRRD